VRYDNSPSAPVVRALPGVPTIAYDRRQCGGRYWVIAARVDSVIATGSLTMHLAHLESAAPRCLTFCAHRRGDQRRRHRDTWARDRDIDLVSRLAWIGG
jgi:hypothetical protein